MSDSADPDPVRLWLVERDYDDRNLVTLVYATPDGERYHQREQSAHLLSQGDGVTAATDADPNDLATVDESTRKRYAREAERMRERHDPDDSV